MELNKIYTTLCLENIMGRIY